jgi:hypothetical protein
LWDGKGRFGDDEPKRKRAKRVVESEEEEEEAGPSSPKVERKKTAVRTMPKRAGKGKERAVSDDRNDEMSRQERMAEVARLGERIRILQAMQDFLLVGEL